jgi:hypothetical protein
MCHVVPCCVSCAHERRLSNTKSHDLLCLRKEQLLVALKATDRNHAILVGSCSPLPLPSVCGYWAHPAHRIDQHTRPRPRQSAEGC